MVINSWIKKHAACKYLVIAVIIIGLLVVGKILLDQKHKSYCLQITSQEFAKYLQSKGFHEAPDGSWVDSKGIIVDGKTENAGERATSKVLNDCLYFR